MARVFSLSSKGRRCLSGFSSAKTFIQSDLPRAIPSIMTSTYTQRLQYDPSTIDAKTLILPRPIMASTHAQHLQHDTSSIAAKTILSAFQKNRPFMASSARHLQHDTSSIAAKTFQKNRPIMASSAQHLQHDTSSIGCPRQFSTNSSITNPVQNPGVINPLQNQRVINPLQNQRVVNPRSKSSIRRPITGQNTPYWLTGNSGSTPYSSFLDYVIARWGGPYKQIYSMDPEYVRKKFFESGIKEELYGIRRYISSTVADLRRLGHLLNSCEYISVVDFERWFQSSGENSRHYILDFIKGYRVNVVAQSNYTLLSYPALTVGYEAPPAGINKFNTDGAFLDSGIPGVPGEAGWGGVWRDAANNLGPVYSGKVDGIFTSYQAEMCGIYYGAVESYEDSDLRNAPWVWENDNLDLVNAINSGIHIPDQNFKVKHSDIESILSAFPYCHPPQYVPREGNRLADFIAGEARDGRLIDLSEVLRRAVDDPFLTSYRLKYIRRDRIN